MLIVSNIVYCVILLDTEYTSNAWGRPTSFYEQTTTIREQGGMGGATANRQLSVYKEVWA